MDSARESLTASPAIHNSDRSPLYDVRNPANTLRRAWMQKCFRGRYQPKQGIAQSRPSGGARRDRTDDLMLAKHALSQLSYGPVPEDERCLAPIKWWAWEDLNFRPHAYQARALTN